MSGVVVQKLLHAGLSRMVLQEGYDRVAGFVVEAAAAATLDTPEKLLSGYGFAGDEPATVDVVRFLVPPGARVSAPVDESRPWPTYENGFLRPVDGALVPVWQVSYTRWPAGAELWRIHTDGTQEQVSWYRGAALGWHGVPVWRPPSRWVGCRAVWHGAEYAADVRGDQVELTAVEQPPSTACWQQVRAGVWTTTVPVEDTEIFELQFTGTYQGIPVRIVDVHGATGTVILQTSDPRAAATVNATMIDPGVFQVPAVDLREIEQTRLAARQWTPVPSK